MKLERHMKHRKRRFKVATLILAASVVALIVSGSGSAHRSSGNTLIVAVATTPPTLDTEYFTGAPQSWEIGDNIYDALHYYKTNLAAGTRDFVNPQLFTPHLATSITHNAAYDVWTVHLRQGVRNNVGDEMTAADWIWSWKRAFALKAVGSFLASQMKITSMSQVKELNNFTVQFHTNGPTVLPNNIWTLSFIPIVDVKQVLPHTSKSDPWARNWLATNAAGFGPYYISSYTPGVQLVLTANPNYYRGVPNIGTVIYKEVPEASNRLALIESGAVDVALGLSPTELTQVKNANNPNLEIYDPGTAGSNNEIALTMNTSYAPFKNPLVRQALSWAVPYQEILTDVEQGWAEPLKSWLPPMYPGYTDAYFPFTTNDAKAEALLKQAGVTLPLKVTAVYSTVAHPEDEALMVAVQTAFAKIGVDMTLDPVTAAEFAQLTFKRSPQMLLGASLQAHPIDAVFGLSQFANCSASLGFLNWGNYCNQTVQKLFTAAANSTVLPQRDKDIELIQKAFEADPPWLVLGRWPFAVVHTKNVTGFDWAPDDGLKFFELSMSS